MLNYMKLNDEIFSDVFAVFNYLIKQGWSGIPFHTLPYFEAMTLYDNRMAAAPMPMSPLYLQIFTIYLHPYMI